jgi:thioredoxin 1
MLHISADSNAPLRAEPLIGDVTVETLFKHHQSFQAAYDAYEPASILPSKYLPELEVYILFGSWCHDSQREVPKFLQLLHRLDISEQQIYLIGLSVDKVEPKGRETLFDVIKTPTFVLLKNKIEIGRITEKPIVSLESDLQIILDRY